MLRLWRDYLAQSPGRNYWHRAASAVSYALPGKAGNLYRFVAGPRRASRGWRRNWSSPWSPTGSPTASRACGHTYDPEERRRCSALPPHKRIADWPHLTTPLTAATPYATTLS